MRIAVSGTHFSGKSTLVADLARRLPNLEAVDEPYHVLEEEGYAFPEDPTVEDFEQQLSTSLQLLAEHDGDAVFDRSPVDFIAYALSSVGGDGFDLERWLPKVRSAMEGLDLIVYLPADSGDPIPVPASQDDDFRTQVDERLREMLVENSLDFDMEVLEVTGTPELRLRQVLERIERLQ